MADEQEAKAGRFSAVSKKTWGAMLATAILCLLLGAGSSYLLIKNLAPPPEINQSQSLSTLPTIYMTLTPSFITNFAVTGRERYLQVELSFMFREPTLEQQIGLHLPAIRNAIVALLGKQDFAALHTVMGKDKLRDDIRTAVNNILRVEQALAVKNAPELSVSAEVEQVLFTNFVMQ